MWMAVDIATEVGNFALGVSFITDARPLIVAGPNGAGKTTLLLTLLGLLRPHAGRIAFAENVLFDDKTGVDVSPEQRCIGYVPQDLALFPHMTVREHVEFALACRASGSREHCRMRANRIMAELGLADHADRKPSRLSGGERQCLALARAIAPKPRALLLDEPMSALDIDARAHVRQLLARLLQAWAIPTIIVTHDVNDVHAVGQSVLVLERGKVSQMGTIDELRDAPATSYVRAFVGGSVSAASETGVNV